MADAPKRKWIKKSAFHPGGEKGKLHREMGVPEGEKIPAGRLEAATHSSDPEMRRDAIRAKTMNGWHHGGSSPSERLYSAKKVKRG